MSLDLYFESPNVVEHECECSKCGNKHVDSYRDTYAEFNVTHNLTSMADEAQIYGILWCPEENGIQKASDLTERLQAALKIMKEHPREFKGFQPANGWGTYEGFLRFIEEVLQASIDYPDAMVRASR